MDTERRRQQPRPEHLTRISSGRRRRHLERFRERRRQQPRADHSHAVDGVGVASRRRGGVALERGSQVATLVPHCAVNRAATNSSQDPPVLGCCQQPTNSPASGASRSAKSVGPNWRCERTYVAGRAGPAAGHPRADADEDHGALPEGGLLTGFAVSVGVCRNLPPPPTPSRERG